MKLRKIISACLTLSLCAGFAFARVPNDPVSLEANHLLNLQTKSGPAAGAINDADPINGPDWIVPRENGTAILGLTEAYQATHNENFKAGALAAAEYLKKRQEADGAWCEYYNEANGTIVNKNKSVSQAGSALMAFYRLHQLGWEDGGHPYYGNAKKAASYILDAIDNKPGAKNGLAGAGKEYGNFSQRDNLGAYQWNGWSWVSDNGYAYIALSCMQEWAAAQGDTALADACGKHAAGVLNGINTYLKNPHNAVWYRVVGPNGELVSESDKVDALCYYPQKLDLPVPQRGRQDIAQWMADNLQITQGTVSEGNGAYRWGSAFGQNSERRSHGFALEAYLALLDIPGSVSEKSRALTKAWWEADDNTNGSGQLWDTSGGGIVDWYGPSDNPHVAPSWQKFIDTSSNCIFAYRGGFNHLLRDAGGTVASNPGGVTAVPGGTTATGTDIVGTSTSTVSADLGSLVVYPNPYNPGGGRFGDTDAGHGIVFDRLTKDADVKVFTLTGELVADLHETGGAGRLVWNACTSSGQQAASGAYVYMVTNPNGEKKTGKLAILR